MTMRPRRLLVLVAALMSLAVVSGDALGKDAAYPAREVNLYIGAPPGGSLDISGRAIAVALGKALGQQVVIVNKPGASQAVAVSHVANASPDGYTLGYLLNPYLTLKKLEEPSLPYGVDRLTWLGSMYKFNFMLTVKADSPWKTYEEFLAAAKSGAKMSFGSDGAGGAQHLLQLKFARQVGMPGYTHVPFGGGGPAVRALLGGHVNAVTISSGPTSAYVKSGDLRWLATFSPARNAEYPDVPTIKQKGLELYGGGWMAFIAPKGLPAPIASKLATAFKQASETDVVKAVFQKMGWEAEYRSPEANVEMWKAEEAVFATELKSLGRLK